MDNKLKNIGQQVRFITCTLLLLMTSCAERQPFNAVPRQPAPPALAAWQPTLHLADSALLSGVPAVALQVSDELLDKDPRNVEALIRRGDALAALNRLSEAGISYSKALELEPKNARAIVGYGRACLAQDPAAAESLFLRAVALDPGDPVAQNDLGVARDMQGHHGSAQEAYRKALGAAPTSVAAKVNLGLSMALSGNAPAAINLLQPLAAAPDALPRIRQDLALALTLGGHRDEAFSILSNELPVSQANRVMEGFEALKP